jgi:AcrR family transcriptional regulator
MPDASARSTVSPPSPRRRGRPRAEPGGDGASVAQALVQTATAQFAAGGFAAVGVRQIAAAAGVDAAMIAHHFGSKLDLWHAVVDQLSDRLTRRLEALPLPGRPGSDAAERLDGAIGHIIDLLCDAPELAAFILREVVLENDRSQDSYARLAKPIHDRLRPLLVDHVAAHGGAGDVDYLFVALNGAIVVSVASRAMLGRMGAGEADDAAFRQRLKATLSARQNAETGCATTPGA